MIDYDAQEVTTIYYSLSGCVSDRQVSNWSTPLNECDGKRGETGVVITCDAPARLQSNSKPIRVIGNKRFD